MKVFNYRPLILLSFLTLFFIPILQASSANQYEWSFIAKKQQTKSIRLEKRLTKLSERIEAREQKRIAEGKASQRKSLLFWARIFIFGGLLLLVLGLAGLTAAIGSTKFVLGVVSFLLGLASIVTGLILSIWNAFQKS